MKVVVPFVLVLIMLACNDNAPVAPPAVMGDAPFASTPPSNSVSPEDGPDDSPPSIGGQLSSPDPVYGTMSSNSTGLRVHYPTVYSISAGGGVSTINLINFVPPLPTSSYTATNHFGVSWTSGSANNSITMGAGPLTLSLRANDTVTSVWMVGGGQYQVDFGDIGGGERRSCGAAYGVWCQKYVGGPIDYQFTRPDASLTFSVDSGTVSTGSTVTFTAGASPDSVAQLPTPISFDTVSWIPDPDSSGGDYTEATTTTNTNGMFTGKPLRYSRKIIGGGTLRAVTHVNGRRFVGTQHVATRDRLKLTAVKSYINRGDTVTFTPSMSDGSAFSMWAWTWKADSTTTPQTQACYWYINPCRTRVYEHGWMTVTVSKNGVQRHARAHVTIGPPPRLAVDVQPNSIELEGIASFVASANGAPVSISRWEFEGQPVTSCGIELHCAIAPSGSGVMWAFGTVDGVADSDSAAVIVTLACESSGNRARATNRVLRLNVSCAPEGQPVVKVTCPVVTRGDNNECVANVLNGIRDGNSSVAWSFESPDLQEPITASTQKAAWPGKMVLQGTVTATVSVGGTPVSGSDVLAVGPRDWSNVEPSSYDYELDSAQVKDSIIRAIKLGNGNLSVPTLGVTTHTSAVSVATKFETVSAGPNKGLAYFLYNPIVRDVKARINYPALSTGSHFWSIQDSTSGAVGAVPAMNCHRDDVVPYRPLVEAHEGVPPTPWSNVLVSAFPINSHSYEFSAMLRDMSRIYVEGVVLKYTTDAALQAAVNGLLRQVEDPALVASAQVDTNHPTVFCQLTFDP